MKLLKYPTICLLFLSVLLTAGCKRAFVRDPETYKAEVAFLQMGLEQNTSLLEEHLKDGSCVCVDGAWVTPLCEDTALNVLVIQNRLEWHIGMMLYLGNLSKERPPEDPPEVPEPGSLCPAGSD